MCKYSSVSVILILVLGLAIIPAGGNAEEYRGLWIDGWHTGMWTQVEINTTIAYAVQGGYNVIVPQIRKKADALYNSTYGGPSGTGEPKPSQVSPSSFDPLAYMIQEAHKIGMEVHPWVCTHRCPTQTYDWFYTSHLDWLTRDSDGDLVNAEGYYLDPGVPDGEEYTVNVMLDIVTRYDVDGIQWDRIRYPGSNSGYNTIARNRYLAECAEVDPDPNFSDWRRKQLNNFVARVYAQIMEVRPDVCVGANTWMDTASGVSNYYQDAPAWMAGHWLDIDVPMNYTSTNSSFNSYLTTHLNNRNGRYVYSGHNVGSTTQANACQQILNARSLNVWKGVPWGEQCYSYYHGTVTKPGWFAYVSAAGRPYEFADTIPALPWKTDGTNTIILGRVTDASNPSDPVYHDWVNRATVNLYHAGPPEINRTMETDQTGYFVFTDVSPKTLSSGYTLTISKSGFATRVFANQAISGGQVLRIDAELGTFAASSPSSAVNPSNTLFSLPYEPVSPAPSAVLPGIPLHQKLTRWNRATQSWISYSQFNPAQFGNFDLDNGYWLKVTAPYTINYQAYGTSSASRTQSLPKAGWNLIGYPFDAEKLWSTMRITSGGTTVDLQQAENNGWINSKGSWWDASAQSLRTVGLANDFPYTQYIKPWHGYYFKTNVDNLQLTQY